MVAVTEVNRGSRSPAGKPWKSLWPWVVVGVFISPSVVAAQTIDTNRPGFSYSPNVVEPGQWQLETGIAYTRADSDTRSTSLPLAEVRVGVADEVEVFVSSLGWSETKSGGREVNGLVDMALGTKVHVSDAESNTQLALLFQVSVPTGDDNFSSDRWDPSVGLVWTHNGPVALAGTAIVREFESGYQLDNSLKMPFSWGEVHSAFVEWEMNLPEDGGGSHWLNGGYQWLIDNRTQVDFNAGVGLNDRAGDYRLGVGFSVLF
jgi:hypothetical protein